MNATVVYWHGIMLAAHARVLGMQAENAHRESCGNGVAYGDEAFFAEAALMENAARAASANG